MMTELCSELNNYFDRDQPKALGCAIHIAGGHITMPEGIEIKNGQYYRIIGSVFNDGVHQYKAGQADASLVDEDCTCSLWLMAVPQEVVKLAADIATWQTQYGAQAVSPFTSENLSASSYSYTKGTFSGNGAGMAIWQNVFGARLAKWRKTRP